MKGNRVGMVCAVVMACVLLAGCGQGSSSGNDAPAAVTPLSYTGKTDAAVIDTLDETQQNNLAVAATQGAVAVIDYMHENQNQALRLLATVVKNTGVLDLAVPTREQVLTLSNPCASPQGTASYHAVSGRYLAVEFNQVCVPSFTAAEIVTFTDLGSTTTGAIGLAVLGIPNPPSEMPLTVSGRLFIDSQYHSVATDALTIVDNENAAVVAIPSGSFQFDDSTPTFPWEQGSKERLFLCKDKVCKVELGYLDEDAAGSYSSYVDSTCTSNCTPAGQFLYVPDLGEFTLVSDHLLPCATDENQDSPFQSGSLTLTGASGSLSVAYNGCGQPFTVTSSN